MAEAALVGFAEGVGTGKPAFFRNLSHRGFSPGKKLHSQIQPFFGNIAGNAYGEGFRKSFADFRGRAAEVFCQGGVTQVIPGEMLVDYVRVYRQKP